MQFDLSELVNRTYQLSAVKPDIASARPLWATLSAAAAASGEPATAAALRKLVADWRAIADEDSAEVDAELKAVEALQAYDEANRLKVSWAQPNAEHRL